VSPHIIQKSLNPKIQAIWRVRYPLALAILTSKAPRVRKWGLGPPSGAFVVYEATEGLIEAKSNGPIVLFGSYRATVLLN
jgi:hypothetical protein